MAQAGLHAYLALMLKNKIPLKKWFFVSFLIGSVIPDIDMILIPFTIFFQNIEKSVNLIHRTFSHSIFSLIIIYLFILIIYEIKKEKKYIAIANGFCLGVLLHITLDTFLWFQSIHIFWPLPMNHINLWEDIKLPDIIKFSLMALEFLLFRLFAWEMIKITIKFPMDAVSFIKKLSIFMKIELFYFVFFSISAFYIQDDLIYYIFGGLYIHSITLMIYSLYNLRENINKYAMSVEKKDREYFRNKSSIHNIQ